MKRSFLLKKRGEIWYYRLANENTFHSTGLPNKNKAHEFANQKSIEATASLNKIIEEQTFKEYSTPYFIWETCPRVKRKLSELKSIGKSHVLKNRQLMEKWIYPDKFSNLKMKDITRADILNFRDKLADKVGANTVNKIIETIKSILSEAFYREEILRNPGSKIGPIRYDKEETGVLTKAELYKMFNTDGIWNSNRTYVCFLTTAMTGMRKSEVLAHKWKNIDLNKAVIHIVEAWKTENELGLPKWNLKRTIPISLKLNEILIDFKNECLTNKDENLVFCYENGVRLGSTYWQKNFNAAVVKMGINRKERNLTPHSTRHSLNTHLISDGCDPLKVQEYFGWSNNAMPIFLTKVQKGYTHLNHDDLRILIPHIDKIFF